MKLTCTGADLSRAAAWAAKIAPSNPSSPVMAGVLLDAGDVLTLSATDYETFGTATCSNAVIQDQGRTVVSARLLAAVAKAITPPSAEATLVADGSRLEVRCGKSRWALPEMETDLWPTFPSVGDPIGKVGGAVLERALDRVLPAAGGPDVKPPILSGVLLEFSDGLTLTATDRYRIATTKLPWQPAIEAPNSIAVPASMLRHASTAGDVEISADGGVVGVRSGGYTILGRILAEKYPPLGKIMAAPKANAAVTTTIRVQDLLAAIDGVAIVLGKENQLIVEFGEYGVSVRPAEGDGDADSQVDLISHEGADVEVKIKHEVIADALRCLDSPAAVLTFGNKNQRGETVDPGTQAFIAEPANAAGSLLEDDSYLHVMMPMSKKQAVKP